MLNIHDLHKISQFSSWAFHVPKFLALSNACTFSKSLHVQTFVARSFCKGHRGVGRRRHGRVLLLSVMKLHLRLEIWCWWCKNGLPVAIFCFKWQFWIRHQCLRHLNLCWCEVLKRQRMADETDFSTTGPSNNVIWHIDLIELDSDHASIVVVKVSRSDFQPVKLPWSQVTCPGLQIVGLQNIEHRSTRNKTHLKTYQEYPRMIY